jgi:hypothetical protein
MDEFLSLGDWVAQMEEVPSFKKMTELKSGNLFFHPKSYIETVWANAYQKYLGKHGVEVTVIQ